MFTSKQFNTQLLVLFLLFLYTINGSCITLTKAVKEKPPLIIEMITDEHLGKFSEHGISKDMVSVVYSYLDIVSAFNLSITNRSFYCLFHDQLDWVKFYYYTTVCSKMNSGGKKFDQQLLRKILSLSLTKQDHVYFPQAPVDCHRYLMHTALASKVNPPLEFYWQHFFLSFHKHLIEFTVCPFGNEKSKCSSHNLFTEELVICSKILKTRLDYIGHHKHLKLQHVKIPFLYVFEHVHNSHDELIFFFQNCSFQYYDDFFETLAHKAQEDKIYFFLINYEGDMCGICIDVTEPWNTQCQIVGILPKKNPKQQYKLKKLFYLPSISFSKD